MAVHPYAEDTVVRIKATGEFAIVKQVCYLRDGKEFLHYLGEIEGKAGLWALYHDRVELESLPLDTSQGKY